ncbi:hypothetical protein V8E54_007557 [Elaphomyces granulatus]
MPRLKINGQEREDVPMLVTDLGAKCDMIFGRQWLEEFCIPLDYDKKSVVQKDQKNIPISSRGSSLDIDVGNEKAVSVIVTLSCSYHESCKIQDASDVTTLPCENQEGDPYRSRILTARSDMLLRVPVVRLPDQRGNDLQPHRPGDSYRHEEKDPDGEDIDSEDIPVAGALLSLETSEHDESQKNQIDDSIVEAKGDPCQPCVRLPETDDFQFHKPDGSFFCIGVPETPIATSKDRIIMDEDIAVAWKVRLPSRQQTDTLCLPHIKEGRPYCFLPANPVEEACRTEAAWNEEICGPNDHYEDGNSDIPDGKKMKKKPESRSLTVY